MLKKKDTYNTVTLEKVTVTVAKDSSVVVNRGILLINRCSYVLGKIFLPPHQVCRYSESYSLLMFAVTLKHYFTRCNYSKQKETVVARHWNAPIQSDRTFIFH